MEFIQYDETAPVLKELGILQSRNDEEQLRFVLEAHAEKEVQCVYIATSECTVDGPDDATRLTQDIDAIIHTIDHIFHNLHLTQFLLIPIGKWRRVFDAVAFSMASNEDWQEIDAAATVELNTRDPLICGPADVQVVMSLISALFSDAETVDQGFTITTTAVPLLIEIVPEGAACISVGTKALADEILAACPA